MKSRTLLMIPGPIEFTPEALAPMASPTTSHVAPDFIESFGEVLEQLRSVFLSPAGQPFVVAGSGTLAMEMAAANLVERGDRVLVVNTGYFSDRFTAILSRYGAAVTSVNALRPGGAPSTEEVDRALAASDFKLMTITHVDTSTGVRTDVKQLAALARTRNTLVVVDGVCSVAGEELRQDEWGVDLALTASQKALGVPPGLAIVMAGPRALEAFRRRTSPVASFFCDWKEWLPIMQAYESRTPAYFATPPVNHIWSLQASLGQILREGMEARWARHAQLSRAFNAGAAALNLTPVPLASELAANTLTALYYPEGIDASLVKSISEQGVIVAGGLHPQIRTRYFRVGHMGAVTGTDILSTLGAIELALHKHGVLKHTGSGVSTALSVLRST